MPTLGWQREMSFVQHGSDRPFRPCYGLSEMRKLPMSRVRRTDKEIDVGAKPK